MSEKQSRFDTWNVKAHPDFQSFMDDLTAVFKKHNKIIVPTYSGEISFHDSLLIVPLEEDCLKFVQKSAWNPLTFGLPDPKS